MAFFEAASDSMQITLDAKYGIYPVVIVPSIGGLRITSRRD
ncbi:MAG: hypothetical protein WCB01_11355 [Candidatus Cybelea sp.]